MALDASILKQKYRKYMFDYVKQLKEILSKTKYFSKKILSVISNGKYADDKYYLKILDEEFKNYLNQYLKEAASYLNIDLETWSGISLPSDLSTATKQLVSSVLENKLKEKIAEYPDEITNNPSEFYKKINIHDMVYKLVKQVLSSEDIVKKGEVKVKKGSLLQDEILDYFSDSLKLKIPDYLIKQKDLQNLKNYIISNVDTELNKLDDPKTNYKEWPESRWTGLKLTVYDYVSSEEYIDKLLSSYENGKFQSKYINKYLSGVITLHVFSNERFKEFRDPIEDEEYQKKEYDTPLSKIRNIANSSEDESKIPQEELLKNTEDIKKFISKLKSDEEKYWQTAGASAQSAIVLSPARQDRLARRREINLKNIEKEKQKQNITDPELFIKILKDLNVEQFTNKFISDDESDQEIKMKGSDRVFSYRFLYSLKNILEKSNIEEEKNKSFEQLNTLLYSLSKNQNLNLKNLLTQIVEEVFVNNEDFYKNFEKYKEQKFYKESPESFSKLLTDLGVPNFINKFDSDVESEESLKLDKVNRKYAYKYLSDLKTYLGNFNKEEKNITFQNIINLINDLQNKANLNISLMEVLSNITDNVLSLDANKELSKELIDYRDKTKSSQVDLSDEDVSKVYHKHNEPKFSREVLLNDTNSDTDITYLVKPSFRSINVRELFADPPRRSYKVIDGEEAKQKNIKFSFLDINFKKRLTAALKQLDEDNSMLEDAFLDKPKRSTEKDEPKRLDVWAREQESGKISDEEDENDIDTDTEDPDLEDDSLEDEKIELQESNFNNIKIILKEGKILLLKESESFENKNENLKKSIAKTFNIIISIIEQKLKLNKKIVLDAFKQEEKERKQIIAKDENLDAVQSDEYLKDTFLKKETVQHINKFLSAVDAAVPKKDDESYIKYRQNLLDYCKILAEEFMEREILIFREKYETDVEDPAELSAQDNIDSSDTESQKASGAGSSPYISNKYTIIAVEGGTEIPRAICEFQRNEKIISSRVSRMNKSNDIFVIDAQRAKKLGVGQAQSKTISSMPQPPASKPKTSTQDIEQSFPYKVGQQINHSTFGVGKITRINTPGKKFSVLFNNPELKIREKTFLMSALQNKSQFPDAKLQEAVEKPEDIGSFVLLCVDKSGDLRMAPIWGSNEEMLLNTADYMKYINAEMSEAESIGMEDDLEDENTEQPIADQQKDKYKQLLKTFQPSNKTNWVGKKDLTADQIEEIITTIYALKKEGKINIPVKNFLEIYLDPQSQINRLTDLINKELIELEDEENSQKDEDNLDTDLELDAEEDEDLNLQEKFNLKLVKRNNILEVKKAPIKKNFRDLFKINAIRLLKL